MLLSFKGKLFPFAGGTDRRRRQRPKPSGLLVTENLESRTLLTGLAVDEAVVTVDEGSTATQIVTLVDANGSVIQEHARVLWNASVGGLSQVTGSCNTWLWTLNAADGPDDGQLVTITAGDAYVEFTLVVNNVAPTVGADNVSVTITEGETATNVGTFFDPAFAEVPPPPQGG